MNAGPAENYIFYSKVRLHISNQGLKIWIRINCATIIFLEGNKEVSEALTFPLWSFQNEDTHVVANARLYPFCLMQTPGSFSQRLNRVFDTGHVDFSFPSAFAALVVVLLTFKALIKRKISFLVLIRNSSGN